MIERPHGFPVRVPGFKFNLDQVQAGWLSARVQSDRYWARVEASYLSDGIAHLLDAILTLANGAKTARCSWYIEPGEYRWIFDQSNGAVSFHILGFRDGELAEPDAAGTFVFETTLPLQLLAAAITRQVCVQGPPLGTPMRGGTPTLTSCSLRSSAT